MRIDDIADLIERNQEIPFKPAFMTEFQYATLYHLYINTCHVCERHKRWWGDILLIEEEYGK